MARSQLLALVLPLILTACMATRQQAPTAAPTRSMGEILAASDPAEWRTPDPQQTLYLELPVGRVVIELAPAFAPVHVANIKALVAERYFDGLAILRAQDNFVVQWGDPAGDDPAQARGVGKAQRTLPGEFTRPWQDSLPFTRLPDADGYAPEVGFSDGLPVGRDPAARTIWPAHCYGTLGVGRGNASDSGGGTELYVVTGHAPRQLDRNITVAGRVIAGMELLSALPRGPAPMGFYVEPAQRTVISAIRLAAEVPPAERTAIELLRTDSLSFRALIEARRNRRDDWYLVPAGYIDLCNVPLPARQPPAVASD